MLSEEIYQLRRKSGLSQEQLAEAIGVSRQAVSKWECGAATPELEKLMTLSTYFHVTMDELVTGHKAEPTETRESNRGRKLGLGLCGTGMMGLILSGGMMLIQPSAAQQVNASSTVTVNGSGILSLLCVSAVLIGIYLIFKRNKRK